MKRKIWQLVNWTFSQRKSNLFSVHKGLIFLKHCLPENCRNSLIYVITCIVCMNTSYLHIHYKTQVRLLITECRVWYIPYLEINGWWSNRLLFTPNNTAKILYQYCICTCVTMRIIEKCNRPKLFYDNRPKWPILFTAFRPTVLCNWISIWNTGWW